MPLLISRLTKRIFLCLLTLALVSVLSPDGAQAGEFGNLGYAIDESAPHSRSHVLVQLGPGTDARSVLGSESRLFAKGWFRVEVPPGETPLTWATTLSKRSGVLTAELDPVFERLATPPFAANDPLYVSGGGNPAAQWHLHAVNVDGAWQGTVGADTVVAVLDTGVSAGPDGFCHPLVWEYDAVTESTGPGSAADEDGHGSHVAGSIAQCSGNATGGAGMAPEARVLPVDVFAGNLASTGDVVQGIDWAIAHGADVINLSLGGDNGLHSTAMDGAIARAIAANVLVVAASGNEPVGVFYPASHPDVLAVGATHINNGVAGYSARGTGLDVVAPGGDQSGPIWQETGGTYKGFSGTSMAAGHVSGAAALMRAMHPTATWDQVRSAINCSAKDLGQGGWDWSTGNGLLDAGSAVEQLGLMVAFGTTGCVDPPPGAGDRVGSVEPATGIWRLHEGGFTTHQFYFGNPGDFGFMGDWDCDGVDTPGLYRQSDGYVYLRNSNTQGVADVAFFFGNPGDVPLAGDFDGDDCDTVSIYRPSEARFYVINQLGSADKGLGAADFSFLYGNVGDKPFVGDWTGDGIDTPGLRRDSDGFVYLRNTNTQGVADVAYFYGDAGDVVFAGDWDADGDDTLGLYRPSNGYVYLRNTNTTGIADYQFPVGAGKHPVSGEK